MTALVKVYTRLFGEDIRTLKRIAKEKGYPWQIELRTLVHRALKEREIAILEVAPKTTMKP